MRVSATGYMNFDVVLTRTELERILREQAAGKFCSMARADGVHAYGVDDDDKPAKVVPTLYLVCKNEYSRDWAVKEKWGAVSLLVSTETLEKLQRGDFVQPIHALQGQWKLHLDTAKV